ncbi:MAG TPA: cytochrome c3 family protein [Gemmatimonadaceae bacterium]|nr:cytochrome c3 family protein [Gemmatimonadaceae bacterium]
MTQRRMWTAIPGLLLLVIGAVVLSAYSGASSSQGNQPTQPINFPHPKHAGAVKDGGLGMNCLYCHNTANKSQDVGMPAVNTCMGCHMVVAAQRPEIQKLAKFAADKRPIPWVRIHKVPEYVHFPHVRHVNAGVTCQTCHGQVQKMAQVYQYASLNMGWCVNCHVNGYDPKEGQKAAGYDNVAPAGYAGGAPYGTPGTRAGISLSSPGMGVVDSARATSAADTVATSTASTPSAERRRARYDCASCHY